MSVIVGINLARGYKKEKLDLAQHGPRLSEAAAEKKHQIPNTKTPEKPQNPKPQLGIGA
jgi:hypothetical protein